MWPFGFFAMESKKEFVNSSLPYLPVTHRAAGQTMDSPAPKSSFAQELKGAAENFAHAFWLVVVCYFGQILFWSENCAKTPHHELSVVFFEAFSGDSNVWLESLFHNVSCWFIDFQSRWHPSHLPGLKSIPKKPAWKSSLQKTGDLKDVKPRDPKQFRCQLWCSLAGRLERQVSENGNSVN